MQESNSDAKLTALRGLAFLQERNNNPRYLGASMNVKRLAADREYVMPPDYHFPLEEAGLRKNGNIPSEILDAIAETLGGRHPTV
jgi:hypothetical protein